MIAFFSFAAISLFLLGSIFGSFLNVLIYRYGTGISAIFRRSHCFSCGTTLSSLELIPIFGFLYLEGRCRSCGTRISFQYPLVEALTGIAFVVSGYLATSHFTDLSRTSGLVFLFLASLSFVSLGIVVYDIRHKIIPSLFLGLFLILSLLVPIQPFLPHLLDLSITNQELTSLRLGLDAGLFLFLPFFLLWYFSEGRWMGLGDGMLAIGIGWLLGLEAGLTAVMVGVWLGMLYGITGILLSFLSAHTPRALSGLNFSSMNLTMKSEIPFAPFLLVGVLVVHFCACNLIQLSFSVL